MKFGFALLCLIVLSSSLLVESLWKQSLQSHTAAGWSARRNPYNKRHLVDPVGPADTIYTTVLIIGGRTYRVIMDTGSSTTFLVGLNCTQAGSSSKCQYATNIFPYQGTSSLIDYDPNQCNNGQITYDGKTNACGLNALYADGTHIDGVGVATTATFGPYSGSTKISMGYQASPGFLLAGTDGIWGMTRPNPMFVGVAGPLATAITQGMPAVFAMCLKWQGGGELHLGGYDSNYATSAIQWVPYDTQAGHYVITMNSLSVGSSAISGSSADIILDSGSTVGYFATATFNSILSAIESQCPTCPTSIFTTSSSAATTTSIWPTITLTLSTGSGGTITVALDGENYLLPAGTPGQFFGGFVDGGSTTLFGGAILRNWYTIFDIANNRIGLGPVNIDRCTDSLGPAAPLTTMTPSTTIPPNPPFAFQNVPGNIPPAPAAPPTAPPPTTPITPTAPTPSPVTTPTAGPAPITIQPAGSVPSNAASATVAFGPFAIVLAVAVCLVSLW